jgi:hypothetical protein
LYAQAQTFVAAIRARAKCDFAFFPLPAEGFHVTFLDGINQGNTAFLNPTRRRDLTADLLSPADIFAYPLPVPREISFPDPIEMQFDQLAIWGGGVLVATLRPVDSSRELFECVQEERRKMDRTMMDELGKPLAHSLTPHLSLGYFAYPEIGKSAEEFLPEWNNLAGEQLTASIRFEGAEVHAFENMTKFVRCPSRTSVHSMTRGPSRTPLVRACIRARIWDMPRSANWSLTPAELEMIERLVEETPTTAVTPKQFFVAWHGVPTFAFEDFGADLFDLKCRLHTNLLRLKPENPGALWPKITLGALNDGRSLTNTEANKLYEICQAIDAKVAKLRLRINTLKVVAFQCRSLESRYVSHPIALNSAAPTQLSSESSPAFEAHKAAVAKTLTALSPSEILSGLKTSEPRLSRYREPHSEFTLVADVADSHLLDCIREFREQVDFWLPGVYTWFAESSMHLTIRGLMPK